MIEHGAMCFLIVTGQSLTHYLSSGFPAGGDVTLGRAFIGATVGGKFGGDGLGVLGRMLANSFTKR